MLQGGVLVLYMYLCTVWELHVYMYVCVHSHTHFLIHTHTHMYTHPHMYTHAHTHTHTHTHTYTHIDEDWREGEFRDLSYSGNFDPTQSLPPVPAGRPTLGTSLSLIEEGKEATNQVDGGYMSRSLERGTTYVSQTRDKFLKLLHYVNLLVGIYTCTLYNVYVYVRMTYVHMCMYMRACSYRN